MIKASELIRAAPIYLGIPYSKLDCQAFVERCLKDAGIDMNLAGSNAWYREVMKNGWVGSPEDCKKKYGSIPKGCFLFILSDNGKEPEKYQGDGIGNASHIGIYTGLTGAEMCDMAISDGIGDADRYNFGNGAIHSSSSRGYVCTSKFAGKTISGGWNRIGLWDELDYGLTNEKPGEEDKEDAKMKAEVWAENGATVNMRCEPSTKAALVERVPVGDEVEIIDQIGDWAYISWNGRKGYMLRQYLKISGNQADPGGGDTVQVSREWLEGIYHEIGKYLGKE